MGSWRERLTRPNSSVRSSSSFREVLVPETGALLTVLGVSEVAQAWARGQSMAFTVDPNQREKTAFSRAVRDLNLIRGQREKLNDVQRTNTPLYRWMPIRTTL